MKKKPKKKVPALDKYCIFCIIFFVLYTIAERTLSAVTGITNDRLTEAVQWFCGGELFFCAMLKRLKLKKEDTNNDGLDTTKLERSDYISSGNSRAD